MGFTTLAAQSLKPYSGHRESNSLTQSVSGSSPTQPTVSRITFDWLLALKCVTLQAHGDLDTIVVRLTIDQLVAAPSRTCQLPSTIES